MEKAQGSALTTLYSAALGDALVSLAEPLRRFHSAPRGSKAAGQVTIQRGRGLKARLLGWLLRLPAAGHCLAATIHVFPASGREIWERRFGRRQFVSVQQMVAGELVERLGWVTWTYQMRAAPAGYRVSSTRCQLLGLTLPDSLALRVRADVIALPGCWYLDLRMQQGGCELLSVTGDWNAVEMGRAR